MQTSTNQVKAAASAIFALAEAIRELRSVPAGTLYATVLGHMDLATFDSFIARLCGSGLVRREPNHLLVWTGPTF